MHSSDIFDSEKLAQVYLPWTFQYAYMEIIRIKMKADNEILQCMQGVRWVV